MKKLSEDYAKFVVKAASMSTGVTVGEMLSGARDREIVIARQLVMYHLTREKELKDEDVMDIVKRDRTTILHGRRQIANGLITKFGPIVKAKEEFDSLIKLGNMEALLKEAERRDEIANEAEQDRQERLKHLNRYQRNYKKVVAKLIRTEMNPPTEEDFDLLNRILKH